MTVVYFMTYFPGRKDMVFIDKTCNLLCAYKLV